MNLGNLASQLKDFEGAITHYTAVVECSPYANEQAHEPRSVQWSGKLNSYEAYCDAHTNLACLLSNMDK